MAYHPNDAEPGDRMDGTMPKGVATQESLQQAFEAFKDLAAGRNELNLLENKSEFSE